MQEPSLCRCLVQQLSPVWSFQQALNSCRLSSARCRRACLFYNSASCALELAGRFTQPAQGIDSISHLCRYCHIYDFGTNVWLLVRSLRCICTRGELFMSFDLVITGGTVIDG